MEHAASCRSSWSSIPAGEIYFSFRSTSDSGSPILHSALEENGRSRASLCCHFDISCTWLHLLLCALHLLVRRFRVGRSLRFYGGRHGCDARRSSPFPISLQ